MGDLEQIINSLKNIETTISKKEEFLGKIVQGKYFGAELSKKYNWFVICKRWNSWYPSFFETEGGGYLLIINNRVLAIDPGFSFLRVLKKLSIPFECVEAVIVTHFHPDHVEGLMEFLTLKNEMVSKNGLRGNSPNTEEENSSCFLFLNPTSYHQFQSFHSDAIKIQDLSPDDIVELFEDENGSPKVIVHVKRAFHGEVGGTQSSLGLILEIRDPNMSSPLKIGITGDTDSLPEHMLLYEQAYSSVNLLCLHLGCFKDQAAMKGKHLYARGVIQLVEKLKGVKEFVISEVGMEMGTNREILSTMGDFVRINREEIILLLFQELLNPEKNVVEIQLLTHMFLKALHYCASFSPKRLIFSISFNLLLDGKEFIQLPSMDEKKIHEIQKWILDKRTLFWNLKTDPKWMNEVEVTSIVKRALYKLESILSKQMKEVLQKNVTRIVSVFKQEGLLTEFANILTSKMWEILASKPISPSKSENQLQGPWGALKKPQTDSSQDEEKKWMEYLFFLFLWQQKPPILFKCKKFKINVDYTLFDKFSVDWKEIKILLRDEKRKKDIQDFVLSLLVSFLYLVLFCANKVKLKSKKNIVDLDSRVEVANHLHEFFHQRNGQFIIPGDFGMRIRLEKPLRYFLVCPTCLTESKFLPLEGNFQKAILKPKSQKIVLTYQNSCQTCQMAKAFEESRSEEAEYYINEWEELQAEYYTTRHFRELNNFWPSHLDDYMDVCDPKLSLPIKFQFFKDLGFFEDLEADNWDEIGKAAMRLVIRRLRSPCGEDDFFIWLLQEGTQKIIIAECVEDHKKIIVYDSDCYDVYCKRYIQESEEIPECGTQKVCDNCGFDQFTVGVGIWYPDADIDSDTFDSLIVVMRCSRCWNTSTESFP